MLRLVKTDITSDLLPTITEFVLYVRATVRDKIKGLSKLVLNFNRQVIIFAVREPGRKKHE